MTDTAFYDGMDELAAKLLSKFGSLATLRRITVGEIGADGKAAKTSADFAGLAVRLSNKEMKDRYAPVSQYAFVYKGAGEPQLDDLIIHAGLTVKLTDEITKVSPEGTRLIVCFVGGNPA